MARVSEDTLHPEGAREGLGGVLGAGILTIVGRVGLGIVLAFVFSVVGIALAWGFYVFSGAVSRTTLLAMFMSGAGIGAGIGGVLAWLSLDRNSPSTLIPMILLALLVGVGGAWAEYEYGANKEIECCAKPDIGAFTYTAFGATFTANAAVLLLGIAREIIARRR